MSNPHCIACEQLDDWIEIDIRDECNQAFSGITAFVTDMVGNKQELMLSGGPQLVARLAKGEVSLTLDTEPWLAVSMARKPLLGEASALLDYTAQKSGFSDTPKTYLHMTSGDLVTQAPTTALPERHQAGQGKSTAIKLCSQNSYVIEVKSFHWLTVRMGLFFDGTGNNTDNALWGREQQEKQLNDWMAKCGADTPQALQAMKKICEAPAGVKVEGSAANELTNIQKLKDLYIDDEHKNESLYQVGEYVQGIGTSLTAPDDEGAEGDDTLGSGMGRGDRGVEARVEQGYTKIMDNFKIEHWPEIQDSYDGIGKFEFDLFGFSRGAAARHCVNQILLKEDNPVADYVAESLSDISLHPAFDWQDNRYCHVHIVGIFDTVAAIGNLTDGLNAHDNDNGDVKLYLDPKRVGQVVHITAHPVMSFAITFPLTASIMPQATPAVTLSNWPFPAVIPTLVVAMLHGIFMMVNCKIMSRILPIANSSG